LFIMSAPSDNIWIGDLPADFHDDQLRQVFEGYGTIVSCRLNPPKNPGQKASGLVRFANAQDATWVVENLNGNMPEGFMEPIIVQYAKSGGAGGGGGSWGKGPGAGGKGAPQEVVNVQPYAITPPKGSGKGGGGPPAQPGDNIWVGDLPPDFSEDQLKQVFEGYGAIVSCRVIPPKNPGQKAAALIRFQNIEDATWVVENLNGNMPEGFVEPIIVQFARGGGGGGKGGDAGYGGGYGKAAHGKGPDLRSQPYASPYAPAYANQPPPPQDGGKGGHKGAPQCSFREFYKGLAKGGVLPGTGQRPDEQCVYVKGLPADTSDLSMYELFSVFGAIAPQGVKAMLKPDGTCTSVGFVDFQESATASAAVAAVNGAVLPDGSILLANLKRSRGQGPTKGGGKGPGW